MPDRLRRKSPLLFLRLDRRSPLPLCLMGSALLHGLLLTVRFNAPEPLRPIAQNLPLALALVKDEQQSDSSLPNSAQRQAHQARRLAQVQALTLTSPEQRAQLAALGRRIEAQNAQPRRHYLSLTAPQPSYALYYERLKRKIEARGRQNFPKTRQGKKLYGALILRLVLDHGGRVVGTPEVLQSSGNSGLDSQARTIAQYAAPFEPFTPSMRAQSDQLVVVARWAFTRERMNLSKAAAETSTSTKMP